MNFLKMNKREIIDTHIQLLCANRMLFFCQGDSENRMCSLDVTDAKLCVPFHLLGLLFVKNGLVFEIKLVNLCSTDILKVPFSSGYSIQKAKMSLNRLLRPCLLFLCSGFLEWYLYCLKHHSLSPGLKMFFHLFIHSTNKHLYTSHCSVDLGHICQEKRQKSILCWRL